MKMLVAQAPFFPALTTNEVLCRDNGCCCTSKVGPSLQNISMFERKSGGNLSQVFRWREPRRRGEANCLLGVKGSFLGSLKQQQSFVVREPKSRLQCCAASANGVSGGLTEGEIAKLKAIAREVADDINGSNIFLVGMMGSGKTTVGKLLANVMMYSFFDSDKVVEQASGASVAEIFKENGEEFFRDYESSVLQELSLQTRCVVATGGGAVLRPTNWGYMRQGLTVYLDVPLPVLAKRCLDMNVASRPLLSASETTQEAAPEDQALSRLREVFAARKDMYMNADFVVSLQDIAADIGRPGEEDSILPFTIAYQVLEEMLTKLRKKRRDSLRAKGELWKEYNVEM